jgi:hypothetical protein
MEEALNGQDVEGAILEERVPASRVAAVPLELVDSAWPRVRSWFVGALAMSVQHELTIDELYEGARAGEFLILLMEVGDEIVAAAAVMQSTRPDSRPYLALVCCGGSEIDRWISELVEACKKIARAGGIDQIVVCGRPGWVRALRPFGLAHRASILTLDLSIAGE